VYRSVSRGIFKRKDATDFEINEKTQMTAFEIIAVHSEWNLF